MKEEEGLEVGSTTISESHISALISHYHTHTPSHSHTHIAGRYIPPHLRAVTEGESRDGDYGGSYGGPPSAGGGRSGKTLVTTAVMIVRQF